jgi:prefoldin subunit 5
MAPPVSASPSLDDDGAAAIQKYAAFVEDVLKPQLQASLAQRDALGLEIREYEELQQFVDEQLQPAAPTRLSTLMDLGQRFHVRAKISDTSMITVDIGLNFHAEMTMEEARAFLVQHLQHLHECVAPQANALVATKSVCVHGVSVQQEAADVAAQGARGLGAHQRRAGRHHETRGAAESRGARAVGTAGETIAALRYGKPASIRQR